MATGATEFVDVTTAAVFIPVIYSKQATIAREQVILFGNLFNRQFEKEMAYGTTIKIPNVSNLAARTKDTSANAAVTFETVTETNVTLTVGTWEYSAMAVETATAKQTDRDMVALYADKMGYAVGLAADATLASLVSGFSQIPTGATLNVELTYEQVLAGDQFLNDANAPIDDRVIVISPAQYAGFKKLDQFVHADYSSLNDGVNSGKVRDQIGSWLNYPVRMTTHVTGSNAAGHDNGMFHKTAAAFVMQMSPTSHHWFDINYLADKYVTEDLYGSLEIRDDHGVYLKGA